MALALLAATTTVLGAPEPAAAAVSFTTQGSINQVYTWGHPAGTALELLDPAGAAVATGTADAQGAKDFRDLAAAAGYRVRSAAGTSDPVTVTDVDSHPDDSFYVGRTTLSEGYGYITARDGTKLAANVTFPKDGSPPPWPVVVDYSGYDPAQPGTTPQEAQLYPHLGYVVVGVNMRGTTCSGGPFWFFEGAQRTDGYDIIETLAHQSWSNGDVGMVGISYSGYSQLYVASTQPPHLRAITPLSPFSDGYRGILYPGGILNDGFALNWALDRQEAAKPAAHQWVKNRINAGDTTCAQNQVMRLQSQDLRNEIIDGRFNEPQYAYLDPVTFVPDIRVPTFLATQWQDEQTGGYGAEVASMIQPNAFLRAELTNGTHVDALGPEYFMQVAEFVDLFVGKRRPTRQGNGFYQAEVAKGLKSIFGTDVKISYTGPPGQTYQEALDWYVAQPPIRIHWEMGGVAGSEGKPYSTVRTNYATWPLPGTSAERWYLQPDGALAKTPPTVPDNVARASSSYTYDPTTKRNTTFTGSTEAMWQSHPNVRWDPLAEGHSLSFVTPVATAKTPYAGNGSVDLWLRSSAADTDLEVTLTEVRPDGKEVYVQSGWLRASRRALDAARSTELRPRHTFQAEDAALLPVGEFVPVRIELFPFAHILRPGSRFRLNIEAPGGNQPFWAFSTLPGTATNEIGHSAGMPSSVVLPKLTDSRVSFFAPSTAPSCSVPGVTAQSQSLRNQPCRTYAPARVPTGVTSVAKGGAVEVSWQPPPTIPGGPALTGYRVVVDPVGEPITVGPDQTTARYGDDAQPGPFWARVQALYGATAGPWSDASLPVTLSTPTVTAARPGDGSATVSWKAPPSPGATVTGYRVTPYRDGVAQPPRTFASTALGQTLTELANGSTYRFTVSPAYGVGWGPPSALSEPIVVGAPSLPGFQKAVPAHQSATVSWWPSTPNGSPITGYVITPYVGDADPVAIPEVAFASAASSQKVTGLTNGQTYRFGIQAVNARGRSPMAVTAPVVVSSTVASAPSNVSVTSGDAAAVVTWSAPSSNGGSPITGYVVTPSLNGTPQAPRTFASTATTQTVTGLTNGGAYTFTVAAVNGAGTGAPSPASAPLIVGTPTRPGFIKATPGNQRVTLTWWGSQGNGGPLTGYVITPYIGATPQAPVVTSTSNTQTITGLTNGVTYTFGIVAMNAYGPGPAGISPAVLVNATVAGAPTSVVAKAGAASATVTWKAPTDTGGTAITGYVVTPWKDGVAQAPRTFGSTALTQTVVGLVDGSSYSFTVQALNSVGPGAASAPSAALVVGAPGSPGFLTATAGAGQVVLNWWVPADNGSPITGYVVTPYVAGVAQTPRSFTGNTNKVTVTGLAAGTTYTFDVAAVNARGESVAARSPAATPS